jgi:hypothetical protein
MHISKAALAAFAVLTVLLMVINVALIRQDRRLAATAKTYEASMHLKVGDTVPPLSGTGPVGGAVTVTYEPSEPKTLLLVFARSCGACVMNWPAWQSVMNRLDPKHTRLVGVSLDNGGLSGQYLQQMGMTTKTSMIPDIMSVIGYRFRYTPQTILIGSDSKVEGIWSGVLNAHQINEVKQESIAAESKPSVAEAKGARSP